MIIFGLQEMVSLNAKNVVLKSTEKPESFWNNLLSATLSKHSFMLVQSTSMVGLYLAVYAKPAWIQAISKVQCEQIKTGFSGTLGNKGAILFSLSVHKSRLTICNCHLASGLK